MERIKFLTKNMLSEFSRKSYNRKLNKKSIDILPDDIKMPVVWHMIHNDYSIRCQIMYNEQGHTFEIDIPIEEFNTLPYVER